MYYCIIADPFHDRGILDDPPVPDGVSFIRGAFIEWVPNAPLIFRSNCDSNNLPRHCMGGALPVWSVALLDAFRSAGVNNLQSFTSIITDDGEGMTWPGYFAINVLGLVAAADLSFSRAQKVGQHPSGLPLLGFERLVIDPRKTQGLVLFRLAENPLKLIVHERILDRLSETAPSGGWGISAEELEERPHKEGRQ